MVTLVFVFNASAVMSQPLPFEPPTQAGATLTRFPAATTPGAGSTTGPVWSETSPDRLDESQQEAMRHSVYALLGLLAVAGVTLAIGAFDAAAKFQAILAFAFLGVSADALVMRMSLRRMATAARGLYVSVVTYVVIDLLLLMGIILWASQMDRASGWSFPATYGPHIPTLFAVAAVLVGALSRSPAAIWVTAIGSCFLHFAAQAVVHDQPGFFFPGPHLLYSFLAVIGTAALTCYLRRRYLAASAH